MPQHGKVSMSVVRRMPRYLRFLSELPADGVLRISSQELAEKMGVTASQIRQDLNCFGGFGQQGYGYNVQALCYEISKILYVEASRPAIIIGAGRMGTAVYTHLDFSTRGFCVAGVFDNSPEVIGKIMKDQKVRPIADLDKFCEEKKPVMAVLCIPKDAAKSLAPELIKNGITAFWNFSHYDISLDYPDCIAENVHMGDSLMTLSYRLNSSDFE